MASLSFDLKTSPTSLPSKKISPLVGGSKYSIALAAEVLPHPLSPTKPKVSPLFTEKLMSSTACTTPTCFLSSTPLAVIGKCLTRFLTSKTVVMLICSQLSEATQPRFLLRARMPRNGQAPFQSEAEPLGCRLLVWRIRIAGGTCIQMAA